MFMQNGVKIFLQFFWKCLLQRNFFTSLEFLFRAFRRKKNDLTVSRAWMVITKKDSIWYLANRHLTFSSLFYSIF